MCRSPGAELSHPVTLTFRFVLMWLFLRFAVLPEAGGKCEQDSFHIYVKYGSTPDSHIKITLGERELTNKIIQQYTHHRNDTHLTIDIPLMSPDVVFEVLYRCPEPDQH